VLVRIVKMEFIPQHIEEFKVLFNNTKTHIKGMQGCEGVQLLQDFDSPNIFFTYSHWQNADALNNYRHSELFINTWNTIKPWFAKRGEAWSVQLIDEQQ
jgi:heme-degrading monooxygenase HmoA